MMHKVWWVCAPVNRDSSQHSYGDEDGELFTLERVTKPFASEALAEGWIVENITELSRFTDTTFFVLSGYIPAHG